MSTWKALAALAMALGIAACGGAPPAGTPRSVASSPAAPPAAEPGGPSAVPPAGGGGSSVAACELLSDEEIEQATGMAVASMEAGSVLGIFENGCEWALEGGVAGAEPGVTVGVISPGGLRYYESFFEPFIGEEGGHVESIAGLGDKASRDEFGDIMAVKGDTLVNVSYSSFPAPDEDVVTPLIEAAVANLP